ncbi:desmethyl-deoxy-podophyllotoxin synthase-like [Aristolochia californica]|uniref:desmethyl-deoxy-podophyllotoxin synthase-like n=1 Tax=Aristolochia californica TaxID=171875 RepID=UPI0035E297B9
MEVHLPSYLALLFCFISFLFFLLNKSRRSKGQNPDQRLPPGPWKLPIIGNIHQLGSQLHKVLFSLSQRYGPLMHLQLGQISLLVVSSPEVAKEIMKTHDLIFSQRPHVLGSSILTYGNRDVINAPYGEYWRQLRKICIVELLSAKRVQSFSRVREEEVSSLIQSISILAGSPINLSKMIFMLTNDIAARTVFGDRCSEQELFKKAMDEAIKLVGGFDVADLFHSSKLIRVISRSEQKFMKIHQRLDRVVSSIIEAHEEIKSRKSKRREEEEEEEDTEDLVDVLLRLQKHGDREFDLSYTNIKAVIFDMFAAGTETSSTTMEWAMSQLIRKPRVMKKAQAEVRSVMKGKMNITENDIKEMSYLKLVIKETFRFCPPVPLLLPRESIEDCRINGYQIPKKTRVLVNCWAIGRDPNYWENPEDFEPERFLGSSVDFRGQNFEFIPFGAGRRGCPGISFGLAIIELTLANLLYHFDWQLPGGMRNEDLDMNEAFGITMARKNSLIVVPVPRS